MSGTDSLDVFEAYTNQPRATSRRATPKQRR